MVVYIRFFEVSVNLALSSESLAQKVSRPIVHVVFEDFFTSLSSDILTQVTIMDFVVRLSESTHGIKLLNEYNFIHKLFETFGGSNEDSFGFITSNMLLVGSKLYQIEPSLFNPFLNQNFMSMFKSYLLGPVDADKPHHKDIALSCLYFIFSQKESCLIKHLIQQPENHEIITAFLRIPKSTNEEHRKSFLVALRMLLKIDHLAPQDENSDSQRISDILQMVFSNICSPQNFPNEFGLIHDAINYLVAIANTTFENEEILCLRLFKQLIKHKWGF